MKNEIEAFNKAKRIILSKTASLNKAVSKRMVEIGDDIEALYELVEQLPVDYNGTRIIFEKIIKIEEKELENE